jgi:hypothetical protein
MIVAEVPKKLLAAGGFKVFKVLRISEFCSGMPVISCDSPHRNGAAQAQNGPQIHAVTVMEVTLPR